MPTTHPSNILLRPGAVPSLRPPTGRIYILFLNANRSGFLTLSNHDGRPEGPALRMEPTGDGWSFTDSRQESTFIAEVDPARACTDYLQAIGRWDQVDEVIIRRLGA